MAALTHRIDLPPFEAADQAERLRSEAHDMAAAYMDTLLNVVPRDLIVGVYVKGSAYKPWDSLIDYVPELSDVDIHVHFLNDDDGHSYLGTPQQALDVAERALSEFSARVPDASHLPRPQLLVLNDLVKLPGYLPSPAGAVHTLYGDIYAGASRDDYGSTQPDDARRFADDARFVDDELPMKVIDRPGKYAWRAVSLLVWRIGPAGPRLLTHLGAHPYDAWSMNRTRIVQELTVRGQRDIAGAYAEFYLAGWDGYRSAFRDGDAARRALHAASRLYSLGKMVIPNPD